MDNVIQVPKPEKTDYQRIAFATEVAFTSLLTTADHQDLALRPVMGNGLEYLPDLQVAEQFKQACRAVLTSLKPV